MGVDPEGWPLTAIEGLLFPLFLSLLAQCTLTQSLHCRPCAQMGEVGFELTSEQPTQMLKLRRHGAGRKKKAPCPWADGVKSSTWQEEPL